MFIINFVDCIFAHYLFSLSYLLIVYVPIYLVPWLLKKFSIT